MPQSFKYTLVQQPEPTRKASPPRLTGAVVDSITFGRGIVTPFRRDGKGDVANADDITLVRSEVRQVLYTMASSGSTLGELPWRPEFGSILEVMRFRNLDETSAELMRTYVVDALKTWLFRVRVRSAEVSLDFDNNAFDVFVVYDILAANSRSVIAPAVTDSVSLPAAA